MKVITQLVQHFWQRQALTADQAEYLVNQGFVRAADLPGFEFATPVNDQPSSFKFKVPVKPPHPLESVEDKLQSKGPTKRARGKPVGATLSEKDLAKAVQRIFDRRAAALESFRRWAQAFGHSDDWVEAAVRVRQASADRMLDELTRAMRKNTVTLSDLWNALDVEPMHALVDSPDWRGPVPRAFRILLTTDGPLSGPHTFLLKHPPLEAAKGLATAHRRLSDAIYRLNEGAPKVLALALKNGNHAAIFWGLIVLYNSRRRPIDGPLRPKREYGPLPLPTPAVWRQAWTLALAMDASSVTKLLVACYQDEHDSKKRDPLHCTIPLHCPLDWRAP